MLAKAIQYATDKHLLQKRKHMQVPFIEHPLRVMHYVINDRQYGGCDEAATIAILHDVVEDCAGETNEERQVLYDEITDKFGPDVNQGVYELTNEFTKARHKKLNRLQRKEKEVQRLKGISDRCKIIKLYDRLANLEDTVKCAPETKKFTLIFATESWDLAFALASHDNAYLSSQVMTLAAQLRDMVNK